MYIDLLSQNSQLSINIKLANLFGLNAAAYLSVLTTIAQAEVENGNVSGTYILNRDYIEKKTTLSPAEQDVCDKVLERIGVLEILDDARTTVGLHLDVLAAMIIESDPKVLADIQKKAKVKRGEEKHSKAYYQIQNIKKKVEDRVSVLIVREAICTWLDSLAEKNQSISSQTVDLWIKTVDNFTTDNSVKVKIYEYAAMLGMYNVDNAIAKYKESTKAGNGSFIGAQQRVGTSIDTKRRF